MARVPRMMRAVAFDRPGGPETLVLREVPVPSPGSGEVLVRVRACAVNRRDLWVRSGAAGFPVPSLPHIPGSDVAGVVAEVGERVAAVQVGAEAILAPGLPCGRCGACERGDEPSCPQFRILGGHVPGGYAEFVVVPERNVIPRPTGLTATQAAALPLTLLTAYHMAFTRGRLRGAETVLVTAASGGVGTAAVQLAVAAGARVIAATSSATKAQALSGLGARRVVSGTPDEWATGVREATSHEGVDLVLDSAGGGVLERALSLLAPGGRAVTCGMTAGPTLSLGLRPFYMRQGSLVGAFLGSRWELLEALRWVEDGRVRPVVGGLFPLAEAARAHEAIEAGTLVGKAVLQVGEEA